jgi:hypothetical protein
MRAVESLAVSTRPGVSGRVVTIPYAFGASTEKEKDVDLAIQGAIWLGAGVTLVMLLSRRRRRRVVR